MPYNFSTKIKNGKKLFCMTSKETKRTYCFKSLSARKKGEKMHEMFKNLKIKK